MFTSGISWSIQCIQWPDGYPDGICPERSPSHVRPRHCVDRTARKPPSGPAIHNEWRRNRCRLRCCIGDRVIAAAILDRLLPHAVTLNIRGNSYLPKDKLKAGPVRTEEAEA